ncbi:MAG TPA: PA14 domain-containing protein [Tepidisphaeraceae bacterium]|nr:PA14 domain-containing protein [Tepidisphaeraceae bacterium]
MAAATRALTPRRRGLNRNSGSSNLHARSALHRAGRAAVESLESRVLLTAVLSYHNDLASTGVNSTETLLTPASVNVSQFQKQYTVPVDGQIYGQPLYDPGVNITTGSQPGIHNVAFVDTQHDSLYGIDTQGGSVLWKLSLTDATNPLVNKLGATTITTVSSTDLNSGDISPEVGITATPVIDPSTNMMYITAKTKQIIGGNGHYVYMLYKVNIQSGAIAASAVIGDTMYANGAYTYRVTDTGTGTDPYVNGTGDGSISSQGTTTWGGTSRVYFNAMRAMDRPGVTLVNGSIYLSFASHGDNGPYHGWVLRYDPSTLALNGALNTTPNGGLGGIWMAGGVLVADSSGNLFAETGNGSFNTSSANFPNGQYAPQDADYGDCFIKITADTVNNSPTKQNVNGWGMKISDYFSPYNNATLNGGDTDLGSGAPVLLPDAVGSAAHPHLLVGAGKEGKIYLLDRDHMGGFSATTDNIVEEQAYSSTAGTGINGSLNTPAFFLNGAGGTSGTLYYFPGYGGNGRQFTVSNGAFSAVATHQTTDTFGSLNGTPSISANGTTNAIVWVIDRGSNTLRAYDATNLSNELWTSNSAPNGRDTLNPATKFSVPTVADGRVMVGTLNALVVYGPPTPATSAPAAPSLLTGAAPNYNNVTLTWQDNSNNESEFLVERSPDGQTNWTQIGTASANSATYTDNTVLSTTPYYYRVRAYNLFQGGSYSAYTNVFTVTTPQAPPTGTGDGLAASYYIDTNGNHLTGTPTVTRVDPFIDSTSQWPNYAPAPAVGNTNFSAKWTGKIQAQYSQTYTFNTQSDDGVRLFVNGQELINDWTNHGQTSDSGSIALSAGQEYTIEMDFFQGGGPDIAQLFWSSTSTPLQIVPQSQLYSGTAPKAPSGLTAIPASATQLNLSWIDNSNNETGFDLEREIGSGGFTSLATLPANTTTYIDTALTPGQGYTYEIRALNFAANSAYSAPFTITTPTPPNKPTNMQEVSATTTQITVEWQDNSNNEDGFRLLRAVAGANFNVIANLPPNTTSYVDNGFGGTGLAPGTEYEYHVQAYNIAGYNDFAGTDTATLTLPPSGLTVAGADKQVTLNWTPPAYSSGNTATLTYNVYRGTAAGNETQLVGSALLNPTFTDTGLADGQAYFYKVTAIDPGGESAASSEVSATPLAPAHVAGITVLGSAWTPAYLADLATAGLGTNGYAIPTGAKQSSALPWSNLDTVRVIFDENVSVQQGDLTLAGVNVPSYAIAGFSYDASTYTATWTLATPIAADRLKLDVAATVQNADGQDLNGAWTDGGSQFPSGDGTASPFVFDFNVLPGDSDGSGTVAFADFVQVSNNFGKSAAANPLLDFNGSGKIDFADFVALSNDFGKSLPAAPAAPAAISALVLKSASPAVVTNAAIAAPLAVTSTRSQTGARKSPATPLAAPTPSVPAVPANNIRVVTQRNLHKL